MNQDVLQLAEMRTDEGRASCGQEQLPDRRHGSRFEMSAARRCCTESGTRAAGDGPMVRIG